MSNIFWYAGLAVIGLGIAAFIMYKKKNFSTLIAFYLFAAGITFTGEYFALAVFQGYLYKPGIFTDLYRDNLAGHMIVNLTLYPGTAIAVWAFSLEYRWISFISASYLLIEVLFVKLGIYEHYWWRYYMTGIIVFTFCIITKIWFDKLNKQIHKYLPYVTLFFIAQVIIQVPIALLLLSGKLYYSVEWTANIYRDSTLFTVILSTSISFIYVIFVCILQNWFWKLIPIVFYLFSDYILINMNILIFQNGWNIFYLSIIHFISLTMFILLNKYSLNKRAGKFLLFNQC